MRYERETNAALMEHWRRWTDVVAMFSKRRNARPQLQRREYCSLHNALVEACQSRAMQCDAEERDYFLNMKNMVQPWISLQTFEQAGHRLLVRLSRRCKETQRTLGCRKYTQGRYRRGALIAAAMLVVAAVAWIFAVNVSAEWAAPVLKDARGGLDRLAILMPPMTWTKRFGMITAVVVIVAIQYVRTSARKY